MTPRKIFLFSPIDTYSAEYVITQLLAMDKESNDEITMFINSGGGYVSSMFAIIDTMNVIKSPVRTVVIGIAASAAAVIASCGKTRLITENSQFMLHEVSSFTFGNLQSMQEDMLQSINQQEKLLNILSKKTGKTIEYIKSLINKTDKYFTASESVSFGLADKVVLDNEAQVLKLSEAINVEGYEIASGDQPEVQILREGEFSHDVYGKVLITEAHLNLMKKNFDDNVRGIEISIDYTHDNEGGESPAACWIKSLEVRSNQDGKGKGLFAKVEFTPKGKKLVSEKEYKYSSADFAIDYIDQNGKHHPYVLRGGTLTNRPFIKEMNAIKLSEYKKKEINKMDKEALMASLLEHGIDVSALQSANTSLTSEVAGLKNQIKELSALPAKHEAEVAELKTKLDAANKEILNGEKEEVFNILLEQGKVTPAQKEDVMNTFDTAEKISNFYKNAPAIVKTAASGSSGDANNNDELTEAEQALVDAGTYTKEQIINTRTIKGNKKV